MGEPWVLPTYPTEPEVDILQDFEYLREYARDHFPPVWYRRLITTPQELDDVHKEIALTKRRYEEARQLHGFVTQAPAHGQRTTKGAIDWEREIMLNIPTVLLEDEEWATLDSRSDMTAVLVGMGDQFKFHQYYFEVLNAKPGNERYHNTDIPIYWLMQAKRLRPEALEVVTWDMDPK